MMYRIQSYWVFGLFPSSRILGTIKHYFSEFFGVLISYRKIRRKETLGRPRSRWVDNIKIDLKRDMMGWYGLDQSGSG
jgi:hypothetical protein